jgi:class 3 adenylate cyclase
MHGRCGNDQVTEMGGKVAKKLGDGLMALFGYPVAQENDAERTEARDKAPKWPLESAWPLAETEDQSSNLQPLRHGRAVDDVFPTHAGCE